MFSFECVWKPHFLEEPENRSAAVNLLTSRQIILPTYQGNIRGPENLMGLSEQLGQKVDVKKLQLVNKMTIVDAGTLEGTSHEERLVMVTLYKENQARLSVRHL